MFWETARLCNFGLMPNPLALRSWPTKYGHPAPEALEKELAQFFSQFQSELEKRDQDPLRFAAWIEKRLNHEIHPLYDGCGRVSKAFAVFALTEAGLSYPNFTSRDQCERLRALPMDQWIAAYRELGSGT